MSAADMWCRKIYIKIKLNGFLFLSIIIKLDSIDIIKIVIILIESVNILR